MSSGKIFLALAVILVAVGIGYGLGERTALPIQSIPAHASPAPPANGGKGKLLYYRNPMGLADTSPVPKQDAMGMDYVPVYESDLRDEPGTVSLSPERIQKLGVRTGAVERRVLTQNVQAVGTVQIDETRQTIVAPRFEGWIEKLRVNATGMQVKQHDPLFDVYSPQLIQIETEYLGFSGLDIGKGVRNGSLERLRSLAVPEEEIARLQKERTVNNAIVIRAPTDATVLTKQAVEGMKFSPGDALYRLVDLSNVWVMVEVYERDLAHIAIGQKARISIDAFPGKVFEGTVGFIYPTISKDTRTATVRIDLPNPQGLLRTDMYANAEIGVGDEQSVLAVPASAILNSGNEQMVLVERSDGLFQPRSIKVGAQGDGYVEVTDGVAEGDKVVTSANFLIDAESNLRAALQAFSAPDAGAGQ